MAETEAQRRIFIILHRHIFEDHRVTLTDDEYDRVYPKVIHAMPPMREPLRNVLCIAYDVSLLDQTLEDVSDLLRALLRVSLLTTFVVHKCNTEACLIPFGPLEVATRNRQ